MLLSLLPDPQRCNGGVAIDENLVAAIALHAPDAVGDPVPSYYLLSSMPPYATHYRAQCLGRRIEFSTADGVKLPILVRDTSPVADVACLTYTS